MIKDLVTQAIKEKEALDMAIKSVSDDCINRQATLAAIIKELCIKNVSYLLQSEKVIYNVVKNMSPVTPTRKVGKWILIDEESNTWQCTNCIKEGKNDWWKLNSGTPKNNKMDYCPHCGAEMRECENG